MNKLRNLLVLIFLLLQCFLIVGCKSTKDIKSDVYVDKNLESYDTTITFTLPYVDSFVMESLHIHNQYNYVCLWVPADTLVYYDTLTFNIKIHKSYVR